MMPAPPQRLARLTALSSWQTSRPQDADGAALVLHADADDYKTDPSGNSGDRFACGVIEFAQ